MRLKTAPARRHRVVVRPKVRSQRARQAAAAFAVLSLGVVAAAALRHLRAQGGPWTARMLPSVCGARLEGLEPALAAQVQRALAQEPGLSRGTEISDFIVRRFGFVAEARCRRSWSGRQAVCSLKPRHAVARAAGAQAAYLGDDGVVFDLPEGQAGPASPLVWTGAAQPQQLKDLAVFIGGASKGLPSALTQARMRSPQDGWELKLEDGTTVLWGDMRWTSQKIQRLREVLADARGQLPGAVAADLRFFEDGRVLVRPGALR